MALPTRQVVPLKDSDIARRWSAVLSLRCLYVAVYFALTLVVEAGIIKSLIHRAQLAANKRWRGGRTAGHLYSRMALQESDLRGDAQGAARVVQGDREDEDVREERLMIESGWCQCF